jgi:hypothetical protein
VNPIEYKRRRRERRIKRTGQSEAEVRRWAEQRGLALRVLNDGNHWLFQKAGFVAEWWPSSAKLVMDRNYDRDHHAPHWAEVRAALEPHLTARAADNR